MILFSHFLSNKITFKKIGGYSLQVKKQYLYSLLIFCTYIFFYHFTENMKIMRFQYKENLKTFPKFQKTSYFLKSPHLMPCFKLELIMTMSDQWICDIKLRAFVMIKLKKVTSKSCKTVVRNHEPPTHEAKIERTRTLKMYLIFGTIIKSLIIQVISILNKVSGCVRKTSAR